jgi:hypothetical protein
MINAKIDGAKRDHMITATRAMIDSINATYGSLGASLSLEEKGTVDWNWQYQRAMDLKETNRELRKVKFAAIAKLYTNHIIDTHTLVGFAFINCMIVVKWIVATTLQ